MAARRRNGRSKSAPPAPQLHERELARLLGQAPCALWATNRELRITHAIGQPRKWAGMDPQSVAGRALQQIIGTDDPNDPLLSAYHAALGGAARTLRYQFREHWFEIHIEPLRDEAGAIVGTAAIGIDVTERREAEGRLAESESRLAEAQAVAHVGSWEWDVVTNQVRWSDEMHRIYGLEPGQFPGTYEAFLDRVLPEDREHTRTTIFDAYRNLGPFRYDHRIVRPDGSVRMLHTRGAAFADEHGRVTRMTGACWDTSDLWEATRALERSVSLLRATLESTADGLLVVDPAGRVVAYNQRLLELWDLREPAMTQGDFERVLALVHERIENGAECLARVREMGSHPDAESFDSLRFLDGRFFERYSRPQRIGDQIAGRVWSYRDVSERERLLRRTQFLSDASRFLVSLEVEGALQAVARLALAELCEAVAIDLCTDGEVRREVAISRDPTHPIARSLPRATLTGNPVLHHAGALSCITAPLVAHGGSLGAIILAAPRPRRFTDGDLDLATELARRVVLAIENGRLYREAREALAARDEFLSIAAHEIRGPVTSLHLAAQGLGRPGGAADGRLLAIVEREDRRIARFVDELLDVTRIRSGKLQYSLAPVDLIEVARDARARFAADLSHCGSTLVIDAPGELVGNWDRGRLDQVVTNLLSNAIKFGRGHPIELRLERAGAVARLVVRDEGIGIPAEALQRVFTPFERAVSARHFGGLGLGLYIVRTIVEAMGGGVSLASEVGVGTTVTVELPLGRDA